MWKMIWSSDVRLAPFLARDYVGVQHENGPARWLQPPVALVSLIVTLEGPIHVGGRAVPAAWIGGLGGECDTVQLGPAHTSVDVKLTPAGFFALTGRSPRELVGSYVEPGEVFGRNGRLLEEQLRGAHTWEQRYAVLDHLLLAQARDTTTPHPLVLEAYSLLQQTSGAISTDALADAVGYSRRHVTAVFHEQMGLPPRQSHDCCDLNASASGCMPLRPDGRISPPTAATAIRPISTATSDSSPAPRQASSFGA